MTGSSRRPHSPIAGTSFPSRTALLVGGAVLAAGTALWVQRQARRAERAHPPAGRFVEVDGVRLHYVERGEGPPVVLLHGNLVQLQDFDASGLIDRLAERHRVVAFDRPGFGWSERPRDRAWTSFAQADVIGRALARLGVERPVVLGHSWGTLVALAMAVDRPEQVSGLVLVSGYYYPTPRLDVALVAPVALPVIGDAMRYTVSPIVGRLTLKQTVRGMFAPQPVSRPFFDHQSREMMLRPRQIRANAEDATFMVSGAERLRKHYPELKLPVRIFAGTDDLVVDCDAHSGRLHRELPRSTLDLVPGAGHMVHYAVPDRIASALGALAGSVGSAVPAVEVADEDARAPLVVRTDEAVLRLDPRP